jgi:hypothetical protein
MKIRENQELISDVMELPTFEKVPVAVKGEDGNFYTQERWIGIREIGKTEAICFATPKYQLVQFGDLTLPFMRNIQGNFKGRVIYFDGKMILDIYPEGNNYENDKVKSGITYINSVEKSTGVIIKCSIWYKGNSLTFPKGFKRNHSFRNVLSTSQVYSIVVAKTQKDWETMMTEFPKVKLSDDNVKEILNDEKLDFSEEMKGIIKKMCYYKNLNDENNKCNLWDFFDFCISYIGSKTYKSEFHKRQNLDKLVEKIVQYNFIAKFSI